MTRGRLEWLWEKMVPFFPLLRHTREKNRFLGTRKRNGEGGCRGKGILERSEMEGKEGLVCKWCGYMAVSEAQLGGHYNRYHEKEMVDVWKKGGSECMGLSEDDPFYMWALLKEERLTDEFARRMMETVKFCGKGVSCG